MAAKKHKAKPRRNRILTVAVLVFAVYTVVMLTQLQLELNDRKEVLDDLVQQQIELERINADLQDKLDNSFKYLEEQARKKGLARPGEIIFQEIPGM